MAGALYSLEKADRLGYPDKRGQAPNLPFFEREFSSALKKIGKGEQPPQLWRAGFWFISALVRLAPLRERRISQGDQRECAR